MKLRCLGYSLNRWVNISRWDSRPNMLCLYLRCHFCIIMLSWQLTASKFQIFVLIRGHLTVRICTSQTNLRKSFNKKRLPLDEVFPFKNAPIFPQTSCWFMPPIMFDFRDNWWWSTTSWGRYASFVWRSSLRDLPYRTESNEPYFALIAWIVLYIWLSLKLPFHLLMRSQFGREFPRACCHESLTRAFVAFNSRRLLEIRMYAYAQCLYVHITTNSCALVHIHIMHCIADQFVTLTFIFGLWNTSSFKLQKGSKSHWFGTTYWKYLNIV